MSRCTRRHHPRRHRPQEAFRRRRAAVLAHGRARRRRRVAGRPARRDLRDRRRIRLREVDPRPAAAAAHRADRRRRASTRASSILALSAERAAPAPARDADHLPGPVRLAQSAHERRRHRRRADLAAWPGERAERRERVAELLRTVGLLAGPRGPLPARVLGRPAPAHRHRPGACGRPEADHRRRAGLGARRVDPGADHQPARGSEGALRPDARHRRARSCRHPPHERPGRRDVSRRDRRARRRRMRSSTTRSTPTRRRLLAAIPVPSPASRAAARRCCRATCRAPPRRRPAAASTPAARMRRPICREQQPALEAAPDGRTVACHFWREIQGAGAGSHQPRRPRARRSPSGWRSTELGANGRTSAVAPGL